MAVRGNLSHAGSEKPGLFDSHHCTLAQAGVARAWRSAIGTPSDVAVRVTFPVRARPVIDARGRA